MERRKLLSGIAGVAAATVTLGTVAFLTEKTESQARPNGAGANPCVVPKGGPLAGYLPNVVLLNQDYYKARFYDDLVMGKKVILNTFATSSQSQVQQKLMTNLTKVQDHLGGRLGQDVFIYSITYDPVHDTPDVLHKFARQLGVKTGWSLLTGVERDVELVLARIGLGPMKMAQGTMPPHFGILRIGNEAISRWTTMPGVYGPHMVLMHLSFVEPLPERTNPNHYERGGPPPKSWIRSFEKKAHEA